MCDIERIRNNLDDEIKVGINYKIRLLAANIDGLSSNLPSVIQNQTGHMYIDVELDTCNLTLGLAANNKYKYKRNMLNYPGTKLTIPDWSIRQCKKREDSGTNKCYGYQINEDNGNEQGMEYYSGELNEYQVLLLKYLLRSAKPISRYSYNIDLPFLYIITPRMLRSAGIWLREGIEKVGITEPTDTYMQCRDFAIYFHKYSEWLYNRIEFLDEYGYPLLDEVDDDDDEIDMDENDVYENWIRGGNITRKTKTPFRNTKKTKTKKTKSKRK